MATKRSFREFTAELLQDQGYSTASVPDGKAALTYLRSQTPSVILLDLMMPGMDGVSFRERQLLEPAIAEIPVVVMTALRTDLPLPNGLTRRVLKPFDIETMVHEIEAATAH